MGKNKKSRISIFDRIKNIPDVELDSKEEYQFYVWLMDAYDNDIVCYYEYQPESFILTEKITYTPIFNNPKNKEKHLFAGHIYTADFKISINPRYGNLFSEYFKISKQNINPTTGIIEIFIDVKGGFMSNDGGRAFSINQKLVFDKYNIIVNKVIPKDFFLKFGCPKQLFVTEKTNKPSKVFSGYKSISDTFR